MNSLFRRRRTAATRRPDPVLTTKFGLLKASELFKDFSDMQMRRLEEMTIMTTCRRGKVIYTPSETGEALFLLKTGLVHLYRLTAEGKKLQVGVVEPGTLFGDMALTANSMADNFAEAADDSLVCVMSRHDLERLILDNPAFAVRLINLLAGRLSEMEARLEESALRDMQARVAAALARESQRQGSTSVAITHQELADAVGTHRETVTRSLQDLQRRGVLDLDRGRIEVRDSAALREASAPGSGPKMQP